MNQESETKRMVGTPMRRSCRHVRRARSEAPYPNSFCVSAFSFFLILLPVLLSSCEREQRTLVVQPPSAEEASLPQVSDLAPGPQHNKAPSVSNPDENNSWMMAEGKRFYEAYNCVGCHAHGGGGMGPPLMDEKWIYGHEPQQSVRDDCRRPA